ncbi:MAG: AMP-binding protein [Acidimicrobiia bacterium]
MSETPRLSYAHGRPGAPLVAKTLADLLAGTVARWPAQEGLVSVAHGARLTWEELALRVNGLARGLIGLGVEPGDRVAVMSPNRPEWVMAQHAVAAIGAVLVAVNPAYRADELAYVLGHAGAEVLLATPAFRTSDYRELVAAAAPMAPKLRATVYFGSPQWDELAAGTAATEAELAARREAVGFDDLACIQYTSGTTGRPKGAALTHHNLVNNALVVPPTLGWAPGAERVCVPAGFFHIFGATVGGLAATALGATIVLPSEAFDAGAVLRALADERCTAMLGVPTMYLALLGHPDRAATDLSSLRSGIVGGAPALPSLFRRIVDELHLPDLQIGFGMTESSPASVHTAVGDPGPKRASTIGRPLPHTEAQIVDPATGRAQPIGAPGELCVRGYLVMRGYWDDPAATATAIDEARWLHTGDLAVMDEEGYVSIVGRLKDMIIRGGENVAATEVEEVLAGHPEVLEAHVVGVADAALGEEVFAWARLGPGATADEDALRDWCRGRLAHFKVPRYVRIVDELPMTASGKVRKADLRRWAEREMRHPPR